MRGIIVNSGNANCCTGSEGLRSVAATAPKLARELGRLHPSQILVCSTGVIGVPLRVEKILNADPATRSRAPVATPAAFARIHPRHHDHRHAPEMGRRKMPHRRQTSSPSRLRQRLRNDPSEHGHDARLSRHRRRDFSRRCFHARCAPSSREPSTPSPSMATHPPTTLSRCSPTANPARRKITKANDDYKNSAPRSKTSANPSRSRSSPTAKARSA